MCFKRVFRITWKFVFELKVELGIQEVKVKVKRSLCPLYRTMKTYRRCFNSVTHDILASLLLDFYLFVKCFDCSCSLVETKRSDLLVHCIYSSKKTKLTVPYLLETEDHHPCNVMTSVCGRYWMNVENNSSIEVTYDLGIGKKLSGPTVFNPSLYFNKYSPYRKLLQKKL
jgi:hypothetical protein